MDLVFYLFILPFLICAACSTFGILLVFGLTSKIKDSKMKKAIRWILVVCVVALAIYALTEGLFSPEFRIM